MLPSEGRKTDDDDDDARSVRQDARTSVAEPSSAANENAAGPRAAIVAATVYGGGSMPDWILDQLPFAQGAHASPNWVCIDRAIQTHICFTPAILRRICRTLLPSKNPFAEAASCILPSTSVLLTVLLFFRTTAQPDEAPFCNAGWRHFGLSK